MKPADSSPAIPPPATRSSPPRVKRFRISMWSLMTGTTAFAILCGFAAALPAAFSQALIGMIWIAATGWLVTGLFFAQGDQRAFCIGAIIVISSTWTRIGGRFLQGVSQIFALLVGNVSMPRAVVAWLDLALLVAVAVFNGWLCIVAQRYFRQQAEE